ncbi:DUF2851 family protein [uncultured Bacteroides sp.]|uniref:DUF2851 family protein n=1 Tax=uncultured Bacteroides sp. TaxID=162156 RepID=UPI002AAA7652|nr:DUF2851 family protein [uncultured Bacteroides sp.]
MEHLLHYIWKHKIFPLKQLETTSGMLVEVIDPGLANTDAGPDFFNSKVKINETLWVGNVEIHSKSSDWFRHGHDKNRAYDSVILHVAEEIDCDISRTNGEPILQMQLSCPAEIEKNYETLHSTDMLPPCYDIIPKMSQFAIHSWLSVLQSERFDHKAEAINARLKLCNGNWEDAFFITLARNFGFGLNGDAFEKWASLIPFRAVDKHRDSLFKVEAIFFGQAGLLEESLDDLYYLRLQKEFAYMKHLFQLPVMDVSLWRFLRLRPGNFPHIRIAQLAFLYSRKWGLFSKLMEAESMKSIKEILQTSTSEYWEEHYQFYSNSPKRTKSLSDSSFNLLAINTVIPFLYAYGRHKAEDALCLRANNLLEELKAEDNYVTRMWHGVGLSVSNAADSQALLELKKEYCDKKKCLYCRIGFEYLKLRK